MTRGKRRVPLPPSSGCAHIVREGKMAPLPTGSFSADGDYDVVMRLNFKNRRCFLGEGRCPWPRKCSGCRPTRLQEPTVVQPLRLLWGRVLNHSIYQFVDPTIPNVSTWPSSPRVCPSPLWLCPRGHRGQRTPSCGLLLFPPAPQCGNGGELFGPGHRPRRDD